MNIYMVRLGPDSVPIITKLDAAGTQAPLQFDVICGQVPTALSVGDFVFVWLGTDNGKGAPTAWKQGLRALGTVTSITGPQEYNAKKTVSISAGYILPNSIGKWDAANSARVNYKEFFNLPVIGSNNYSSQVIQKIDPSKPGQNLGGLIELIDEHNAGFRQAVGAAYPSLPAFFATLPSFSPPIGATAVNQLVGSWRNLVDQQTDLGNLIGMEEPAFRAMAALQAGMHVIFTGPPGTGKTQLAEALCRKAGFAYWTVPATDQWTTFETIGGYFPLPDDSAENGKSDRLDFMPGAIVDAISRGSCLIIDEINRADIDKAFGEMFTLLAGNSVTLPYKRRGPDGFQRIRIQVDDSPPEADMDVIPLPQWWRLIGAMNDADKASLKRLSLAFVRRFAFIPVAPPSRSLYETLLSTRISEFSPTALNDARVQAILEIFKRLFCSDSLGFAAIGMPFGPAIPLAMLRHITKEASIDNTRTSDQLLASALDLYIAPQFQGRADCHEQCVELIRSEISDANIVNQIAKTLAIWTGYDS